MMYAWEFAAKTPDEVSKLVRCLSKHRYVREADHRLHRLVDRALSELAAFAPHSHELTLLEEAGLERNSRDPRNWRPVTLDELAVVFESFWADTRAAAQNRARLEALAVNWGFEWARGAAWSGPPEEPSFPELVLLDWVLLPIDELDTERHAGALGALEDSGDEIDPSAPIHQEAGSIGLAELCQGAEGGRLTSELLVWSEPPYAYADYVFRGAAKAAKLAEPPIGYADYERAAEGEPEGSGEDAGARERS